MELQLKQRLVGITVIFSLAVIFLPMLLDGSGQKPESISISIPPEPNVEIDEKVEIRVIELRKEVERLPELAPVVEDDSAVPDTKAKKPEKPEKSEVTEKAEAKSPTVAKTEKKPSPVIIPEPDPAPPLKQVGGDSWVIQVGSFKDKDKAYKHRDRLRKSKLSSVFIEKFRKNNSTTYRVRMGPFIKKKDANVVKNKVLAKYNVKGLVMRYEK